MNTTKATQNIKSRLFRRLLPLYIAAFAQAASLWVATEKLFMTEIGFDPVSIGLMAAVYAAFVPFVEVPSGILADRWSRRGVLMVAGLALFLATLIGGLSHSVPMYFVSALILGIYFALASGTFEAIIYDTVLEETGDSNAFEKHTGTYRLFMSIGGLSAALLGGIVAAATSPRMTYFISLPVVLMSFFVLLKFREPRLHKMEVALPWRAHLAATYKVLLQKSSIMLIIGQLVLSSALVQLFLEFGSLWLIALEAPVTFYGLAFGALITAPGIAGLLAGRLDFAKLSVRIGVAAILLAGSLSLVVVKNPYVVAGAQVLLSALIITASILFTRLLHDQITSNVRAGVASGIGAFSWVLFVPVSLMFGWLVEEHTVFGGGLLIMGLTITACVLLLVTSVHQYLKSSSAR